MSRNRFFDNLRGFSVLTTLSYHFFGIWAYILYYLHHEPIKLSGISSLACGFGHYGVDVFFTLSGFLIAGSLERHRNLSDFYIRRFARIIPIYYACVACNYLLFFGLVAKLPTPLVDVMHLYHANWVNFPYYLCFLAGYRPYFDPDLSSHLWSLTVEEHFYLTFPLLALLFRRRIVQICVALLVFFLLWRGFVAFFADKVEYDTLYHQSHFRVTGILLGVIVYYRIGWFRGPLRLAAFLLPFTLFYFFYDALSLHQTYLAGSASFWLKCTEWLKQIFPSLLVVFLIANFKDLPIKTKLLIPLEKIGEASLSFYVASYSVNVLVGFVFGLAGIDSFAIYACCTLTMILIVSVGYYIFFEKWLYRHLVDSLTRCFSRRETS